MMKKQNNPLVLSVLATLASAIALIYTLIVYHQFIFAVLGVSVIFLIAAYILTTQLIHLSINQNKAINGQIKDLADGVASQLEAMGTTQAELSKATFLYTKKAAQSVTTLESQNAKNHERLSNSLNSIANIQNKAVKVMVKYDQSNTVKLISSIKDMRNQLNETMIHGFDQIQPNNTDILKTLEDIVAYLKEQPDGINESMSLQLNNLAHELQSISNSIQHLQAPAAPVVMPVHHATEQQAIPEPINDSLPTEAVVETVEETNDTLMEESPVSSELTEDIPTEDIPTDDTVTSEPEETLTEETTTTVDTPVMSDEKLSPDQIAALFAANEPATNPSSEEDTFTPTFTVVEQEEEETAAIPAADENKQLSPEEIASLVSSLV